MHRSLASVVSAARLVAIAVLASCGSDETPAAGTTVATAHQPSRPTVVAAFAPLADAARAIGGDDVDVVTLVGPGQAPHDFEPTPAQAEQLARADLVVYLGGDFQPSVAKLVSETAGSADRLDVLAALGAPDNPHVWLNPASMRKVAAAISDGLRRVTAAPATGRVAARAGDYDAALVALDQDYRAGLARCATTMVITPHDAFRGLTAYGLTMTPIAGLSPAEEPTPKDLETIIAAAKVAKVTTVFFEEALPDQMATTVADEIGGHTAVLNPFETLTAADEAAGVDYLSVMRDNLQALRTGLGCS